MVYGTTAYNKRYTLRRLSAARGSVLLGRLKAPTQHSTHSLQALQTLRVCLFGLANRRIPGTLYAMPIILWKINKNVNLF